MKRPFKIVLNILIIVELIIFAIVLSGCDKSSKEANRAIDYLNNKYKQDSDKWYVRLFGNLYSKDDIEVSGTPYWTDGLLPGTGYDYQNVFYKMNDGTIVIYNYNTKTFADNKQINEIKSDFEKFFYDQVIKLDNSNGKVEEINKYDTNRNSEDYGIFPCECFKNYYNGNIEEFAKKEKIRITGSIIVWSDIDNWESDCEKIQERISKYNIYANNYDGYCIYFMDSKMKNSTDLLNIKYDFSQEGMLGELDIIYDGEHDKYEKYVKLIDGIGVALDSDYNFELKQSDIRFSISRNTNNDVKNLLQNIYDTYNKPSDFNSDTYVINNPIYEISYSNRLNEFINEENINRLKLQFKSKSLYCYSNKQAIKYFDENDIDINDSGSTVSPQTVSKYSNFIYDDELFWFGKKLYGKYTK